MMHGDIQGSYKGYKNLFVMKNGEPMKILDQGSYKGYKNLFVMKNGEPMKILDQGTSIDIANNFFMDTAPHKFNWRGCDKNEKNPEYVQGVITIEKSDDMIPFLNTNTELVYSSNMYILKKTMMIPPTLMNCNYILHDGKWCSELRKNGKKQCLAKTVTNAQCKNYPCSSSKFCYIHSSAEAPKKPNFLKKMETGFKDLIAKVRKAKP
jgi:hypothetical protein